jgi:hypothetical protein
MFRKQATAKQNSTRGRQSTGGTAVALLWVLVLIVVILAIAGGATVSGWLFLLLLVALVLALVGAF